VVALDTDMASYSSYREVRGHARGGEVLACAAPRRRPVTRASLLFPDCPRSTGDRGRSSRIIPADEKKQAALL